jgi:hypothetical protein
MVNARGINPVLQYDYISAIWFHPQRLFHFLAFPQIYWDSSRPQFFTNDSKIAESL